MPPKVCPNVECREDLQFIDERADYIFCPRCRFPLKVIDETYRLKKTLGQGGFGVVYLAEEFESDKLYVIKFLKPEVLGLDAYELLTRFRREIRLTVALAEHSEHIIKIFKVGKDEDLGNYYVMEYLQGRTLEQLLSQEGPLPLPELFELFGQLCTVIAHAHKFGVVHRDLKPENIFVQERAEQKPFIKLLDFGIAKPLAGTLNPELTIGGIGTPSYMSPEQWNNKEVDWRADIYSLGCIFNHLLVGRPPFIEERQMDLMFAHMMGELEPFSKQNPDLQTPEGLEQVLQKALAKDKEDRYPDVESFWEALRPFAPQPVPALTLAPIPGLSQQESEALQDLTLPLLDSHPPDWGADTASFEAPLTIPPPSKPNSVLELEETSELPTASEEDFLDITDEFDPEIPQSHPKFTWMSGALVAIGCVVLFALPNLELFLPELPDTSMHQVVPRVPLKRTQSKKRPVHKSSLIRRLAPHTPSSNTPNSSTSIPTSNPSVDGEGDVLLIGKIPLTTHLREKQKQAKHLNQRIAFLHKVYQEKSHSLCSKHIPCTKVYNQYQQAIVEQDQQRIQERHKQLESATEQLCKQDIPCQNVRFNIAKAMGTYQQLMKKIRRYQKALKEQKKQK